MRRGRRGVAACMAAQASWQQQRRAKSRSNGGFGAARAGVCYLGVSNVRRSTEGRGWEPLDLIARSQLVNKAAQPNGEGRLPSW